MLTLEAMANQTKAVLIHVLLHVESASDRPEDGGRELPEFLA
jgi:hypothetical protein